MLNLSEDIKKIKLIISESDGILTDGTIPVDELCNIPFKNFYNLDFEVINVLKKYFKVVFISKYQEINYNFFRKKNIPFYWADKSKEAVLRKIISRYSVTLDEVLYIGSSYNDLNLIKSVPFSVCPRDALVEIKENSLQLKAKSGKGVFCELYELLKPEIIRRSYAYKEKN